MEDELKLLIGQSVSASQVAEILEIPYSAMLPILQEVLEPAFMVVFTLTVQTLTEILEYVAMYRRGEFMG